MQYVCELSAVAAWCGRLSQLATVRGEKLNGVNCLATEGAEQFWNGCAETVLQG